MTGNINPLDRFTSPNMTAGYVTVNVLFKRVMWQVKTEVHFVIVQQVPACLHLSQITCHGEVTNIAIAEWLYLSMEPPYHYHSKITALLSSVSPYFLSPAPSFALPTIIIIVWICFFLLLCFRSVSYLLCIQIRQLLAAWCLVIVRGAQERVSLLAVHVPSLTVTCSS